MDSDLWGSSFNQAELESNYCFGSGWQCDFFFGYGHDVLEEDALNEKSCIQVLRILITKADTEIDELEKDLVSLQGELAWAEHEEWSEICCDALREKITCLDISIRNLRNKDENDIEVQLLMHREPAENIHEIVEVLLRKYFLEKDEQTPDVIVLNSSSDSSLHATGLLNEHRDLNKLDSNIIVEEEIGETDMILKLQEKKPNDPKTIKPANIMDSSPDSLRLAAAYSDKKKTSSNRDSESTTQWEAKGQGPAPEEKKRSSFYYEQPASTDNSSPDSLRLAAGYSDEKKTSSKSDSESTRHWEAKGQGLAHEEKKTSSMTFNDEQPANTNIMDSSPDSLRLALGYSDQKKTSSNSDSESTTQWGPKGQGLAPEEKKRSRTISNSEQPAKTSIKDSSPDSFRLAADYCDSESTTQCGPKGQGLAPEEKKRSCTISNYEQPAKTSIKDSSPDSFRLAADYSDEKKTSSKSDSESTRQWEAKGLGLSPKEKKPSNIIFNNEEPANTNIMDSSPDSLRLALGYYDKKKTSSNSNSESTTQWEAKGQGLAPEEKKRSCRISNYEQPANTCIKDSSPDSFRLSADYSDVNKTSRKSDSESTRQWEAKGQGLGPEEKKTSSIIFNNEQPANFNVMDSIPYSLRLAAGYSDKKKSSSNSDSEITTQWEAKGQGLAPEEKRRSITISNYEQPANTSIMDSIPDSLRLAADYSDEKKASSKSDSESTRQWEAKGQGLAPEEKKRSCTISNYEQLAITSIMDSSPDSLRLAADYSGEKKTSSKSDSESTRQWVAKRQGLAPEEKKISRMVINNEQPAETNIMDSSPDSLRLIPGYSDKKKTSSNSDSERTWQWEAKGQGLAPEENKRSSMIFINEQPENANIVDSSPDSLRLAAGYSNKKKTSSKSDSESTGKWEDKGQGLAPEEKKMTENASLKHEKKTMQNLEDKCATIKNSSKSVRFSGETEKLRTSDSKIMNEKLKEHTSIPVADTIGSSLRPDGLGTDVGKTLEPADTIVRHFSSGSLRYAYGYSSEMKKSCMPCLTENEYEEVRKQPSTATDKIQILNLSLNPEGKETLQKTEKTANALVKYTSADAFRQSAGINKRNECSESRLYASRLANGGNSDVEQKLIDLVTKTARKVVVKESKVTMANKIGCSNTSPKTGRNGRTHLAIVKFKEGGLTDTEQLTLTLQDRMEKDTTKPKLNDVGEQQKPKTKRKLPLIAQNVEEPYFPSTDMNSCSSFMSKAKRERKLKNDDDNASLKQFLSSMRKSGQLEQCAKDKEHGTSLGISKNSASQSQRKRRKTLDSHRDETHGGSKEDLQMVVYQENDELQIIDPYSLENDSHAGELVPCTVLNLKSMTVTELKGVAKQKNLKGCYKLRKAQLLELLENELDSRSRKERSSDHRALLS